MSAARAILGLVAWILLAGGIVMQFLVILSGVETSPENQIYFLQTTTNNVNNGNQYTFNPTRWTWTRLCGVDSNGLNANCAPTYAAVPFSPVNNFDTTSGIPQDFVDHRAHYYYMSRIAWAFYIIALFFAVVAVFLGFLALCTRLGAYLSSTFCFLAVGMQAIAASLMTAWVVQGYKAWAAAGENPQYGVKAIAFTWATFAAWFLATVIFCIGGAVGKSNDKYSKKSTFGRKRSTRSRGSFLDSENGRRVKDEYE